MEWWQVVAGVLGGLILLWLALIATLAWVSRGQAEKIKLVDALRLGPDVVRLTRRLAADQPFRGAFASGSSCCSATCCCRSILCPTSSR
jgi:hypothetical protein